MFLRGAAIGAAEPRHPLVQRMVEGCSTAAMQDRADHWAHVPMPRALDWELLMALLWSCKTHAANGRDAEAMQAAHDKLQRAAEQIVDLLSDELSPLVASVFLAQMSRSVVRGNELEYAPYKRLLEYLHKHTEHAPDGIGQLQDDTKTLLSCYPLDRQARRPKPGQP